MLYKASIQCKIYEKQLYLSKKMERSVIKVGVANVNVCVLRCLKEELAWAINGFGLLVIKCYL